VIRTRHSNLGRRATVLVAPLVWGLAVGAATAGSVPQRIGQADFPNEDAVVLKHLQKWTLQADGRLVHEEHRFVQLLNDRAWRRYSDPRVDYLEGQEKVELLAARTHLPDGRTLEVPEYAINIVSPSGVSKWPALADWREVVYTFSGVQNDAVLELHYRRTSSPGVHRWVTADLRIGDVDPVLRRTIEVNLPAGEKLLHRLDRADRFTTFARNTVGRGSVYRWQINKVPSDPPEPRCPDWRQRCGRLRFTNCPSAQAWVQDVLGTIESCARPNEAIREFAAAAAEDRVDEAAQARAVCEKLRNTFNFVDDYRGWSGRKVRPLDVVFDSCYGSRLESAALTLAALRAAGLEAQPAVAVDRRTFSDKAPADADLAGIVIEVGAVGEPVLIEPSGGIISRNGVWRHRDLLYDGREGADRLALASFSSQQDTARVRGQLVVDEKAEKITGEMTIELIGLFVDPERLREDGQKKSRVRAIVTEVLPNLKVKDYSVSHLSHDRFVAHASVESTEAPTDVYGRRLVTLAKDTPALAAAHLPVASTKRRLPVQLPGHLSEDVRIRIELPEGWTTAILPESLPAVSGPWGRIAQTVEVDDNAVGIRRQVSFNVEQIPADDYASVRGAVRALHSEAFRSLLIRPEDS